MPPEACLARSLVSRFSLTSIAAQSSRQKAPRTQPLLRASCVGRHRHTYHRYESKNATMMLPSKTLLLAAAASALYVRPTRRTPTRRTVSMKWGEHIDQVKGDNTFLRNKDGRPAQFQRDYGKLIITLATTGNINTRENNKDLPCSPQEMADQMHECIKLGVSILHIHSRNELLKPTMRVDKFRETCRLVKERDPDVIIQISTGGRAPPTAFEGVDVGDWRMDPLNLLPEMGSYTPGSVNLGPIVYQNDAKLTRDMAQKYKDLKIKPQVEVFDTNMISNARCRRAMSTAWRATRG